MDLSRRVRALRYARGWAREELAKRAKISRSALHQIERGHTREPQAGTLKRVATALGVSVEVLLKKSPNSSKAVATDISEATGILPVSTRPAGLVHSSNRTEILMEKFRVLLDSPFADAIARTVEELLRLLPIIRPAPLRDAPDDPAHSDRDPSRSIPLRPHFAGLGSGDSPCGPAG
jgi:transcriptional regulator with XRE-family HTH domain